MSTTMRNAFSLIAIVLLFVQSAEAKDLKLMRTAKSGIDSLIGYERGWDHDCAAIPTTVTITSQPKHGVATIVQGTSTIPTSTPPNGSTGECAGRTITGNQVMYRSQAGYHGTDFIAWDAMTARGNGGHVDVTIAVK
jgi:hypothetical protein